MDAIRKPPVIVPEKTALQRGLAASWKSLLFLSVAVFILAFNLYGLAGFRAVIVSHVLLYAGYALSLLADWLGRRPFNTIRLVCCLSFWFLLAISGPVIQAAGFVREKAGAP